MKVALNKNKIKLSWMDKVLSIKDVLILMIKSLLLLSKD